MQGLEFIDRQVAIVTGDALQSAFDSLHAVLEAYEPEASESLAAIDVKTTGRRFACDIDGGLTEFLMAMLGVLDEAIRSGKPFLFDQPQP